MSKPEPMTALEITAHKLELEAHGCDGCCVFLCADCGHYYEIPNSDVVQDCLVVSQGCIRCRDEE